MKKTHRGWTTAALALGLFVAAMEVTVVSTAMPTVVGEMGGIELYAWIFTGYLLACTITVPVYGKLADVHGRKPVFMVGVALFLVGSLACGFAPTIQWLIAFRVLQGIGAGGIQPLALTIIGDIFDLQQRAKVQGLFGGVWGLAGFVGPLLGGVIVEQLSWPWVFFINLPVAAAAGVLLYVFFHESVEKKPHALDVAGAAVLALTIAAVMFGLQPSKYSMAALLSALPLLLVFVFIERRAKEPIVAPELFSIRVVSVASASAAFFSAAMFGAITYVPLYVQVVLGGTAMQAGGMITPMIVAWPMASAIAGRLIPRIGFRPLVIGGFALAFVSTVAMALLLGAGGQLWMARASMGLFGTGLGFASASLLIAVQTAVAWDMRGMATASNMFFRTIGGSLGVALMGGVLTFHLHHQAGYTEGTAEQLLGPHHGLGLSASTLASLAEALLRALTINFWLIAGFAALAFGVSILFPTFRPNASPVVTAESNLN